MKKIALLNFLIFSFLLCLGQNKNGGDGDSIDINKIIPPEPGVYKFATFGNNSVNLFSGVPQISIPVWEIKEQDISVPINLSYDAQGLKVNDIPSWVGAGWNLSAGGVITRTVRSIPDENCSGTYIGYMCPGHDGLFIPDSLPQSGTNYVYESIMEMESITTYGKIDDQQPDEFYFNMPGHSGKFIYSLYDNKFITIPYQNIKIDYYSNNFNTIDSIRLITDDGFIYWFSCPEITTTYSHGSKSGSIDWNFKSSWFLTRIITPLKNTVLFEYEYDHLYKNTFTQTHKILLGNGNKNKSNKSATSSEIERSSPRLKRIITKNQIIKFIKSDNYRTDIYYLCNNGIPENKRKSYSLKEIQILRRKGNNTTLIKKYNFYESYKIGSQSSVPRLTLDSIAESNETEKLPSYKFFYNKPNLVPSLIQRRKQDHWGYYKKNDTKNNNNILPKIILHGLNNSQTILNSDGSDRNTDTSSVYFGVLNKIQYPTGGYTKYKYEPNNVSNFNLTKTVNYTVHEDDSLYYTKGVICKDNYSTHVNIAESSGKGKIELYFGKTCSGGGGGGNGTISKDHSGLYIYVGNNSYFVGSGYAGESRTIPNVSLQVSNNLSFRFSSNPGSDIKAILKAPETSQISTNHTDTYSINADYVGGLRIKSITDYFDTGKISQKREFTYYGGKVFCVPNYLRTLEKDTWETWENPFDYHRTRFEVYAILSSNNLSVDGKIEGSHVGYSKVTMQKTNSKGEIIKEETEYNQIGDLYNYSYPYIPVFDVDYKIGKIKEKKYFNWENNNFRLIKKQNYQYTSFSEGNASGVLFAKVHNLNNFGKSFPVPYSFTPMPTFAVPEYYTIKNFAWKSSFGYLSKEITRDYFNNEVIETTTDYEYNTDYTQLTKTIKNAATDNEITTSYKYPTDENLNATVPQEMIDKFMINTPVETEKRNYNENIVSANITDYKYENGMVLPDKVRVYNKDLATTLKYEERASYKHDTHGNIVEIKKSDNTPTTIIWGYNNTYPIAKIEGVAYAELTTTQISKIQELDAAVWEYDVNIDDLNNLNNYIRNMLPNAMITTYTYRPLIGQETITDPNGKTTFYEYDNFDRLKTIRDQDGKIIKKIEYNYRQTENY